jgi:general secretion pathway protein G
VHGFLLKNVGLDFRVRGQVRVTTGDELRSKRVKGRSKTRSYKSEQASGFTMVELVVAMAIILTIAAMAIPNLVSAIGLAKTARAVADVTNMEDDVAMYQSIYGVLPDNLTQLGLGSYLDPWQNPYEYLNHSTMKGNGKARKDRFLVPLNSDYDLYSDGPDGQSVSPITAKPSQDDIIRAADGSYVGVAAEF